MASARESMISAAGILLAKQGYQATSFSAVLEASGAPRGSIYHHFRGGKDELVAAALDERLASTLAVVSTLDTTSPVTVADGFVALWRDLLTATQYAVGCAIVGTAVSAVGEVRERSGHHFDTWLAALTDRLVLAGAARDAAADYAALLLSACEGAVAIARAQQSLTTFERTAVQLRTLATTL